MKREWESWNVGLVEKEAIEIHAMNGARESDVDRVFSDGFTDLQGARIAYRSVLGVVSVSNYIWDIWGHTFEVRSIHMEIFLFFFSILVGFLLRKNPNSFHFQELFF